MRLLRRAYRRHQAKLARRTALIAKLDQKSWHAPVLPAATTMVTGSRPLTPWEEIFARPEWERMRQSHRGRCSYCGARVSRRHAICDACGAVWDPEAGTVNWTGRSLFWLVALILSGAGGLIARDLFSRVIEDYCRPDCTGHINLDFVEFTQSYMLFLVAMLLLVLAIFIYEKSHVGQTGAWIPKT